ncbi:hypothetical protein ACNOYE_22580 [Nannocystaceae bacterium ST9]
MSPRARMLASLLLLAACSDDASGPTPEPAPRHAHAPGIRLTELRISQGVETELVVGDEVRTPEQYLVPMLADRPMLVRASFAVHHDFAPRELLGRLSVHYPEGTLDARIEDSLVEVGGDSDLASLKGSFAWYLERDAVRPGMRVRVDVYEPEPLGEDELEPAPDPAALGADRIDAPGLPWAQPSAAIELSSAPMRLKVALIPIEHRLGDCVETAEIDDEDVAAMAEELAENNAVHDVEIRVRDTPVIIDEPIGEQDGGFTPVLSKLSQLRVDEGAPANEYWYGLVVTCDGFPSGLNGQAFGIPSEPVAELAYQRVAAGRWLGEGSVAAETFVHELGHGQGRQHVRCSGTEAGTDSNYPHPGGITNVWGFGLYDLRLHSPAGSRDYMTYCANEWVSDYGWNHTWKYIEALTALDDAALVELGDELLVGVIQPDGSSEWWTTRGAPASAGNEAHVLTWDVEGQTIAVEAGSWELPDGDAMIVTAPVPEGVDERAGFELAGPIVDELGPQGGRLELLRRAKR